MEGYKRLVSQGLPPNSHTALFFTSFRFRYQAFVSGCDEGEAVSGISHALWDENRTDGGGNERVFQTATSLFDRALQTFGGRNVASVVAVTLQWTLSLFARVLTRIPWITAIGGVYVGFRKIVRPWYVGDECLKVMLFDSLLSSA